jgi:hypothetical protein
MNLAHDSGGARTHLDLPIRVRLDDSDDGHSGRDSVDPRRLDRDFRLVEFGLSQ